MMGLPRLARLTDSATKPATSATLKKMPTSSLSKTSCGGGFGGGLQCEGDATTARLSGCLCAAASAQGTGCLTAGRAAPPPTLPSMSLIIFSYFSSSLEAAAATRRCCDCMDLNAAGRRRCEQAGCGTLARPARARAMEPRHLIAHLCCCCGALAAGRGGPVPPCCRLLRGAEGALCCQHAASDRLLNAAGIGANELQPGEVWISNGFTKRGWLE